MERKCQKCGYQLAENDFLCPQCGAIYGEPVYRPPNETPKPEETPVPAVEKRHSGRFAVLGSVALLIVLVCLLIWNPFQPEATTPSTSHTQPTTSAVPTPPPTTLPPMIPTTVPTTAPPPTTLPPTIPTTTLPSNPKQLNWTMDAKVVRPDGSLVSNGTVTIRGTITRNLENADSIVLEIIFPSTLPYIIMPEDYKEYFDLGQGFFGSYYVCKASAYDRLENDPEYIRFALDVEVEYALFILPDDLEQYLVCSTAADVNVEEVMAHFQVFLDSRK